MAKLIICRGLPGSGKSTWANEQVSADIGGTVRVNRDLLRIMINNDIFVPKLSEKVIVAARDAIITKFLKIGLTVISDDTNLDPRVCKALARIANHNGAHVEFKDFDLSVQECIVRDAARTATVGFNVIQGMLKNHFVDGKFPEVPTIDDNVGTDYESATFDFNLPRAFIVDLDSTIAINDHRSPYDYSKVSLDKPNTHVIDVVESMYKDGWNPIFVSGRPESCYFETFKWIEQHVIVGLPTLFTRKNGDSRADNVVKYEIYDRTIRGAWNVLLCIDDRQQVIDMWRQIGLTVLDVAGNIF